MGINYGSTVEECDVLEYGFSRKFLEYIMKIFIAVFFLGKDLLEE